MKKALMIIGLTLLLTALPVFSQGSNTSTKKADSNSPKLTDEQKKQDLYSRWNKLNKNKPAEACQIAADYLVNFPEDKSKNAKILKTWLGDYEKTTKCEVPAENYYEGRSGSKDEKRKARNEGILLRL